MLIMDNDRMALMALQSILSKTLPDFELLPPVSEGSKAIQLCTARCLFRSATPLLVL